MFVAHNSKPNALAELPDAGGLAPATGWPLVDAKIHLERACNQERQKYILIMIYPDEVPIVEISQNFRCVSGLTDKIVNVVNEMSQDRSICLENNTDLLVDETVNANQSLNNQSDQARKPIESI